MEHKTTYDFLGSFFIVEECNAALIEEHNNQGIAIRLADNLGEFDCGDIVVFWQSGAITKLPESFTVIKWNLYA